MKSKETVLLGLSGGVDSAVAALLLKKQGYNVIGAFMINYSDTKNKLTGDCNYLEDKKHAQKIAARLNIPFVTLNFEKEYKKHVIDPMFKAYERGLTPNPDALCNKIIKFPLLWQAAKKHNAKYIATGHYIKRKKNKDGSFSLQIPKDKHKDQSYFLYDLTQKDLEHTLFPIGDSNLTKEEVRVIAKKQRFSNWEKKGTAGICFVGNINMKEFLKQRIRPKPGKIKDRQGKTIGSHQGVMFYTIGERIGPRSGLTLHNDVANKSGKKWYIIEKKARSNVLIAAPEGAKETKKKQFQIIKLNDINKKLANTKKDNIKVRIRHTGELLPATIQKKNNKHYCILKKEIMGLADGQSCVIYENRTNIVLGGGEIRNAE